VPAQNYLTIETPAANQTKNVVSIATITGQIVKNEFFTGNAYTINVEDLDAGMYLLVVKLGNSTCSQIIVKQ
jgi:hypothetical protein